MKYSLFVFDWEGTLADSAWRTIHCFQVAAREFGLSEPSAETVRASCGIDVLHTIRALFPNLSARQCLAVQEQYWRCFLSQDVPVAHLFEGTKEALEALKAKGYKLAVATNKSRAGLNQDMHDTGVATLFASTITVDEAPSKPDPSMLLQLMDQLHQNKDETVMIGDSRSDMEMAQNAGVDAIFMQHNLNEALYPVVIRDIKDLFPI